MEWLRGGSKMAHCSKCGVLDAVGESVICEDCNDNRNNLIDGFIRVAMREPILTQKEIVRMLEALR